jgi:hypothetical protein
MADDDKVVRADFTKKRQPRGAKPKPGVAAIEAVRNCRACVDRGVRLRRPPIPDRALGVANRSGACTQETRTIDTVRALVESLLEVIAAARDGASRRKARAFAPERGAYFFLRAFFAFLAFFAIASSLGWSKTSPRWRGHASGVQLSSDSSAAVMPASQVVHSSMAKDAAITPGLGSSAGRFSPGAGPGDRSFSTGPTAYRPPQTECGIAQAAVGMRSRPHRPLGIPHGPVAQLDRASAF